MDIPTLAGAKYTGPDMFEFRRIIDLGAGQWTVFSGMDEQCEFAAMFGSSGCIGSSLNYYPGAYREIHQAVRSGNHARANELQLRANLTTAIMAAVGFLAALKVVMRWLDLDCGKPRLPTLPLADETGKNLRRQLETVGFSELAAM
jgi:4-hydroxy-tetrahydrodipicolinate synthase